MERVVVYTDGACSGNPGPGGWGWAVSPDGGTRGSGGDPDTTNQRMEVYAVLDAIRTLGADGTPLEIVSDSTYVVNCFRDGWWVGRTIHLAARLTDLCTSGEVVASDDCLRAGRPGLALPSSRSRLVAIRGLAEPCLVHVFDQPSDRPTASSSP